MNKKRRIELNDAFENLQALIQEEREGLDNQEDSFGETSKWQEADEICQGAEQCVDELEDFFSQWEIR